MSAMNQLRLGAVTSSPRTIPEATRKGSKRNCWASILGGVLASCLSTVAVAQTPMQLQMPGQGGGYYDRLIASLRARGPLLVIGLAYAGQELAEVPMERHDQRVDAILTETEFISVVRQP